MNEFEIGEKVRAAWVGELRHLNQFIGIFKGFDKDFNKRIAIVYYPQIGKTVVLLHINSERLEKSMTELKIKVEYPDRPAVWIETNKIRLVST